MALYVKNKAASIEASKDIFDPISLRSKFSGQRCILCGTGPSLKEVDPKVVEKLGYPVVGLNNAFLYITPDIWIGIDEPVAFDPSLFKFKFKKIYQWQRRGDLFNDKKICDYDNFHFFIRAEDKDFKKGGINFAQDHISFICENNTFSSAIHILYWMGFSEVYLVGCDFGGGNDISKCGPKYQKEKYSEPTQKTHLNGALDFLKFSSQNNGVRYVSCTPGSPINEFLEYKNLRDVGAGDIGAARKREKSKYKELQKHLSSYGESNHGKSAVGYVKRHQPKFVVDLGCGKNNFINLLKKDGINGVGVDFVYKEADIVAPMHQVPIEDNKADMVTAFDSLEHLLPQEIDEVFGEMKRIVNPGGMFVFSISYGPSNILIKDQNLHPTVKPEEWWLRRIERYCNVEKYKQYLVGTFK